MPPLSLLAPWFLVGAAAAAVPVVLHLFARETATAVPFSAVHLLEPTPVEQTRRRRVTDLLLLLLRMAMLVLLALAFARPYLAWGAAGERLPVTIVAIDVSGSMGAPATWASARQGAEAAIAGAAPGSLAALVAFSGDARIVVEPTSDRAAARAALDQIAPGSGPTRLGPVFDLARALSRGRRSDLVVISDVPASLAAEARHLWLAEGMEFRLQAVAPPAADLRVVALRRTDTGVAAMVELEGTGPAEAAVTLSLDAQELGRRRVSIEPGQALEVDFDAGLPSAGLISARVDDPGGRPAGDARFLVLDPPPAHRVLVIQSVDTTPDAALYARAALEAEPAGAFSVEVRTANDPLLDTGDWRPATSAVLVLGTRGMERRALGQLAGFVRQGGGMVVAAGASTEALALRDLLARTVVDDVTPDEAAGREATSAAHLVVAATRHPIVAAFGDRASALGEVRVRRATPLVAPDDDVVLRLSSGEPALVQLAIGSGRALVFASDLSGEWNDFPKHPAYVPFLCEAVGFAARLRDEPAVLEVGDTPEADRPGAVTVGTPARRVAVNVPADELGQPPLEEAAVEQLIAHRAVELPPAADTRDEEGRAPLWRLVILAVLALFVAEGIIAGARSLGTARGAS